MRTMVIIGLLIVVGMCSCVKSIESYSDVEMRTLVSIGKADTAKDSIIVRVDDKDYKLPIVLYDGYGYYPALSENNQIRYYLVNE